MSDRPLANEADSDQEATARNWEVQLVSGGFQLTENKPVVAALAQPDNAGSSEQQSPARASLLDSRSHSLEKRASKPSEARPQLAEQPRMMLESELMQNLSEEDSTVNQNRTFTPLQKGKKPSKEPHFVMKYQESVSVESREPDKRVQKKIDRLEGHMRKLEERQRKLEALEVKMEEEIHKVQNRSELFPRITEQPKIKFARPFKITSKLVSLTVENPKVQSQDKEMLHKQIVELRQLIVSLKEIRKPEPMNVFASKQLQGDSNSQGMSRQLPSLEERTSNMQRTENNPSVSRGYNPSEVREQYPSEVRATAMTGLSGERNTIQDMKTVFFNGYIQGGPSRFVPITQQPQQSGSIDPNRDVFLPLNAQSKTMNNRTPGGPRTRTKGSTENFNTAQREAARQFISTRPKYDTRYDTEKKMEHQRREPIKIQVDDPKKTQKNYNSMNPEEFPSPFSQKGPIVLKVPAQSSASQGAGIRFRQNAQPRTVEPIKFRSIEPAQQEMQKMDQMNNAQDDIVIQQAELDSPGNISNIEQIQYRTTEDLKKNLLVFPKLPKGLNPLLNSEELVVLAKEVYALFSINIRERDEPNLTIRKYRNCVYFCFQNRHVLWHYSGKFYMGGWEKGREEGGKSGRGIQMVPDNYIYEGEFVNGKREGYGVLNSVKGDNYVGQWYQGLRHGKGRLEEQAGNVYEGQWKQGKKDGFGKLTFGGIEEYQGSFEDGLKHGFGRQTYKNRDSYKGQYFMGRFSGEGTYKWANGAVYQGQFLNGLRHGRGIWKSNARGKGDTYEGEYCQDKKSGLGKYIWQNGSTYEGYFSNDLKHGQGTLRYSDGVVVEGIWDKGNLKVQLYNSSLPIERKEFRQEPSKKIQFSAKEFNFS